MTTRSVEPGRVVLPSRPLLLRVVDLSQVYLRGLIPGGQIAQVRVGQLANVYLNNDPKHQKSFKATSTTGVWCKLNLEQPSRLAKPGMPADAEIPLR
ncbi:MAG: HlyD family efflux transporter periplasmic adaptor subunit [Nostoc sp.]|uniref:HlyD family efflux transporter periplasmic adaptor subunit n=1 Tax=Nostoc sp. TaxID=1180 RepID=UPI002FF59E0B